MGAGKQQNLHATGVVVGHRGMIVTGPSGSGKSSLALELVVRSRLSGRFACLIADDQLFVSVHNGKLVVAAPEPIAGLAEIRGHGVAPIDYEPRAVIDLVVELTSPEQAPRHRRDVTRTVEGVVLPCLELPMRDTAGSVRAVLARLERFDTRQAG
jgi:serine kinase of HPr protein (carbohydrate metabolism regulator)